MSKTSEPVLKHQITVKIFNFHPKTVTNGYKRFSATNGYFRLQTATNGYVHCYRFSASQPKNGNVVDAERPASAPIADAGKTAPAPGAGAVAVFLGAGCRSLPMPRFGTISGNGIRHRWKRANPTRRRERRRRGYDRRVGYNRRGVWAELSVIFCALTPSSPHPSLILILGGF